jgi:hypothetical protein
MPPPPRKIIVCLPVRSYATPNRGPTTSFGQVYPYFEMPSPAWRMPLSGLPTPGTGVPIAAWLLGEFGIARTCPVIGLTAFFVLPEQTTAPLLQPAT